MILEFHWLVGKMTDLSAGKRTRIGTQQCVLKREIEAEFPKFLKELKDHYKRAKEEKKAEHSLRSTAP